MTFDVLEFFTAAPPSIEDQNGLRWCDEGKESRSNTSEAKSQVKIEGDKAKDESEEGMKIEEYGPLHVLDLPMLKLEPSFGALLVVLKLLAPSKVVNFGSEPNEKLECKGITLEEVEGAEGLHSCPRFNTVAKLELALEWVDFLKIRMEREYNSYLTSIIASPLPWLTSEHTSIIHQLASLRLSENCGRSAFPGFTREIELRDGNFGPIRLKEPALTSDNLGLKTWGSSLMLANRIARQNISNDNEQNEHNEPRTTVLELGAGTGLVGIVMSKLGFDCTLTDLPEIVPNLTENLFLNNCKAKALVLDWNNPSAFELSEKYDLVVASDPIYSSEHPQLLVNTVSHFVHERSTVILQLPLRRNYDDQRDNLWELMDQKFELSEEEIEPGMDDFGDMTYVYRRYRPINTLG